VIGSLVALRGCLQQAPEKTPQAPPPTPVTVSTIKAANTAVVTEFVGKTASSRRGEIRSRVEGFLEAREYQQGTLVQERQVMFQMDPEPFEAQLRAARAELAQQAKLTNADANLKRVRQGA
jgi:membrane fusion protein (multidrug efflux system)